MSRRRGEFEHRTSIFEGAFRAWSFLGGIDLTDLDTKSALDLDPFGDPTSGDGSGVGDSSVNNDTKKNPNDNPDDANNTSTKRREYPYEPLPRSGLAHPFVQAILSPWLGPDADQDAIQLGLTTLRTWWQHRRKGESGSAIVALGTGRMKGVVEGYSRHFFSLAHCLVVNDKEQPPRTLHSRMREREKQQGKRKSGGGGSGGGGGLPGANKKSKKRSREEELASMAYSAGFDQQGQQGGNQMMGMNLPGQMYSIEQGSVFL